MERQFTFNHFNVTLDFQTKQVSLQDDLTIVPKRENELGLDEFEKPSKNANEVSWAIPTILRLLLSVDARRRLPSVLVT